MGLAFKPARGNNTHHKGGGGGSLLSKTTLKPNRDPIDDPEYVQTIFANYCPIISKS